ncbi:MAG: hypothetical protein ABH848_03290 [Candidatus Omnitrophota bacterium]
MNRNEKRLGDILVEKKFVSLEELHSALEQQKKTKEFLGAILVKKSIIKEEDLLKSLSEQFNIPFVSLKYKYIDWDFIGRFSPSLILDMKCIPIKEDEYSMTIAITNPLDAWAIKRCEEEISPFKLKLALITREDVEDMIHRYKEYIQNKKP